MPKQLKEIRNFNDGTILNSSEKDIPETAAAFSLNIDSMAEDGVLDAIPNDRIAVSIDNNTIEFLEPISWGSTSLHTLPANNINQSEVSLDDVTIFDELGTAKLFFIGTKGRKEVLRANNIQPYFEKVFASDILASLGVAAETITATSASDTVDIDNGSGADPYNSTADGQDALDIKYTNEEIFDENGKIFGKVTASAIGGNPTTLTLGDGVRNTITNNQTLYTKVTAYYTPPSAVTATQITLPYFTDTNAITSASITSGCAIAGMTGGTGSITISTTTLTNLHDGYFTIISTSGISKSYIFNKDSMTTQTGDIVSGKVLIGIYGLGSFDLIADEIMKAINHPNGHNGRVQAVDGGTGIVSISYNEPVLSDIFSIGDYVKFGPAYTDEIIKIESIDTDNNQFNIKRGCFGTKKEAVTAGDIYANRVTIADEQISTTKGLLTLTGWSDYSGNHNGGNSAYYQRCDSANDRKACGVFQADDYNIVFSNADKTLKITGYTSSLLYHEGDIITVYYGADGADEPNNGKTFKILKKTQDTHTIFTLDPAPADDTYVADADFFIEGNLLKNHTFHHASDEVNPTVEVHSSQPYKCNNWLHKSYQWDPAAGGDPPAVSNNYISVNTTEVVLVTSGGGSWQDYSVEPWESEDRYPFVTNDVYITLEAEYKDTGENITDLTIDATFIEISNPTTKFSKGDVLKLQNEYMKILSYTPNGINVSRGILGSAAAVHSGAQDLYKSINTSIGQSVSKDYLKAGQPYILSFHAKDEYATSNYGEGYLSIRFNGGYIDKSGNWNESIDDIFSQGRSTDAKSSAMQEQRWIPFSDLEKFEGDSISTRGEADALDTRWRKFGIKFYPKKKIQFASDLEIEFLSQGKEGTKIALDSTSLYQYNPIVIDNQDIEFKTVGKIDNKGQKDLVVYDYKNQDIKMITDFKEDELKLQNSETNIEKSIKASDSLVSDDDTAVMIPRNRELHMGFGSGNSSTSPQFLGYLNHECFNQDFNGLLYQDEDTVHSYDDVGIMSMSKVCLAGENEYLSAYWNHTGSPVDDGESGTLNLAGTTMRIYHASHRMKAGDNIVVRQYGDTANEWDGEGVWVVTAGDGLAYFECKRNTDKDPNPATTGDAGTKFKVCYRPYMYYGMRFDDYYLYRIFPDTRIKADLSLDLTIPAGTIQKSLPLAYNILSIATCHNKITNGTTGGDATGGTGGGMIYALTSSNYNEVKVLDVQMKYNQWTSLPFTEQSTLTLRFKSFKWSNDHLNGNINGDTAVFDTLAEESTPSIDYTGTLCDILETRGTTKDYIHNTTSLTGNPPDHFDTRLWIQTRPSGDDAFGEGDRFLFCGRTEGATAGTGIYVTSDIMLGDRTPPTLTTKPEDFRWDGSNFRFQCGPGIDGQDIFESSHSAGSDKKLYNVRAFTWNDDNENYHVGVDDNPPVINFGENISWQGEGDETASIRVARFGMFPISDNDGDGILDGTGVVIPSTTSLPTTINNQEMGNYGKHHERVTGHAVGLLGASDIPWVRNWGAVDGCDHKITSGDRYYQGADARAPEDMESSKLVFICSDIHFGDRVPALTSSDDDYARYYLIPSAAAANGNGTRFTVPSTANLQAGDAMFIHCRGSNVDNTEAGHLDDRDASSYIVSIDSTTTFTVSTVYHADFNDYIAVTMLFPGSPSMFHQNINLSSNGRQSVENFFRGSLNIDHPHWAYDKDEPDNGDIFLEASGALYSKTWYTSPSSKGLSPTEAQEWTKQYVGSGSNYMHGEYSKYMYPGILFKLDRLNYRAGYMIRPFDMSDNTFQDLEIGLGTFIEMPSKPDVIYHKKQSTARDLHIDNTEVHNEFASRIYVTSPSPDTYTTSNKSKVYIIDPKFQFPNMTNQIVKEKGSSGTDTNGWNGDWKSHEPYIYGTLSDTTGTNSMPHVTLAATTTNAHRYADKYPLIIVDGTATNFTDNNGILATSSNLWTEDNKFTGMMLSIIDATTGTIQTRYIVGSSFASDKFYFALHYPLGHRVNTGDMFYIWDHAYACTSTMRLFRETDLVIDAANDGEASMKALIADPLLSLSLYKNNGVDDGSDKVDRSGTTVEFNTLVNHNLTTNDEVEIFDASDADLHGVYSITVTDPKVFTYTTASTGTITDATASWKLNEAETSNATVANPVQLDMKAPLIKTMFGGLDMRKLRGATIGSIANNVDDITITTSANHLFDVGDTVTINSGNATQDGIYPITADNGTTTFDVTNTVHTTSTGPVTTNQWESFVMATGGNGFASEIRSGFSAWDRGKATANLLRGDNATATPAQLFLNDTESSVTIKPTSLGNEEGDYFIKNNNYDYKISLMYDGYQEGPLSHSTWTYIDTVATRNKLSIEILVKQYSKRLTHVCLYRRNNTNSFYKLIEQITTATGWSYDGDTYKRIITDAGNTRGSYESRTGRSEILDSIKVKYGMAAEIDGYLFVGNCAHEKIKDASNQLFRSRPGQYSIFDYGSDFIQLKSKPTALANFAGRLYAFDHNNIYKINQQNLAIEDTFEGIGCSGSKSIIITEFGMFFADKNGAYMHNGTQANKISSTIEHGGSTDKTWVGTDNIKDLSWTTIGKSSLAEPTLVTFDSGTSSVLFIVKYLDYNSSKGLSVPKYYCWSYNLLKKRWDLWELCEDSIIGHPFIGDKGGIFIPIDNCIYEYKGGSSKRDYTWLSKKLTIQEDSISKVFNKVKINGITSNLVLDGSYKESSDRLLIKTSTGDIASSELTYSTPSEGHSEYKLKSSNKKGRWLQLKLEDMTESVDSIALIFRRKATK